MQLTIKSNADLVRQGLQDLSSQPVKIGRRKIFDAMNRITREMEGYPGERPGQRYIRTGNLGASWQVRRLEDGYQIYNNASHKGRRYARYVVGDAYGQGQAWMHSGRWQLFRDVVEDEIDKLPEEVANELDLVARRLLPQGGD
ncbi:MAG TPA: hypothetical protein DEB56_00725 [Thiobacillus sp.]|nr:hypothetical protein [Thiobacillus sp.]